jgi:hypothetical protein
VEFLSAKSLRPKSTAVTENNSVERIGDGSFKLVIGHEYEFDCLESAFLQLNYPALRTALSEHLERASKKACHTGRIFWHC